MDKPRQEENLYTPNCIRTFTGKYVNVFDPKPSMICIEDIAHALSMLCRFGGHTKRFYSVAQHSVACADACPLELKMQALLHDAAEAYLVNLPSPVKKGLDGYRYLESEMMKTIAQKFEFEYPCNPLVLRGDQYQLEYEWRNIVIYDSGMECLSPTEAEQNFLFVYRQLKSIK